VNIADGRLLVAESRRLLIAESIGDWTMNRQSPMIDPRSAITDLQPAIRYDANLQSAICNLQFP
jgi:hypothetical protein